MNKKHMLDALGGICKVVESGNRATSRLLFEMQEKANHGEVHGFMSRKVELMRAILRMMPLSSPCCPYCIEMSSPSHAFSKKDCDNCYYGKTHGICIDRKKPSAYASVSKALDNLMVELRKLED